MTQHERRSAERIAINVEARLRAVGTAERAEIERRYLRSSLEHLGATVPQVRAAVRALVSAREAPDRRALTEIALALWAAPVHERRLAAAVALQRHSALLVPGDLTTLRRLIRESRTWALVDVLADRVAGDIIARHPESLPALDEWALDHEMWLRRAALLAMLRSARDGAMPDRFWRYADAMLDEREFFIRQSAGCSENTPAGNPTRSSRGCNSEPRAPPV